MIKFEVFPYWRIVNFLLIIAIEEEEGYHSYNIDQLKIIKEKKTRRVKGTEVNK